MKTHFFSRRRRVLAMVVLVCCLLVFGVTASAIFSSRVQGDDPWTAPDSYFTETGTGPDILTQQQYKDNQATKTALDQLVLDRMAGPPGGGDFSSKTGPTPVITQVVDDPIPTGVLQTNLSEPSGWGSYYNIDNTWQDMINEVRTDAFAGLIYDGTISSQVDTPSQPAQGVLIIDTFPATNSNVSASEKEYVPSTRTGSLHLTAASGSCLSLISTSKVVYKFDVVTRQWSCTP
jgi:hypothetical protein